MPLVPGNEVVARVEPRRLPVSADLGVVGRDRAEIIGRRGSAWAEDDAAQRVGRGDDAAGRRVVDADLAGDEVEGQAVGCGAGRVDHDTALIALPRPRVAADAIVESQFARHRDVAAPVRAKLGAPGQRCEIRAVVAIGRHAAGQVGLDPVEIVVEHEVDDTRQRVRTIDRRRAASHDIDAGHQRVGNVIDVGRGERGGDRAVDDPLAVEQDQSPGRTETSKADLIDTQRAAADGGRLAGLGDAVGGLGQLIDRVGDVNIGASSQDVGTQHGQWRRRGEAVANHARAGDDDILVPAAGFTRWCLIGLGGSIGIGGGYGRGRRGLGGGLGSSPSRYQRQHRHRNRR